MYKAVLFASDGEHVTDYHNTETIEQVENKIDNQVSRWFFYPFAAVIKDNNSNITNNRILSICDELTSLKGKTVKTARDYIKNNPDYIDDLLQR
jgi:hypothetical protein